MFDLQDVFLDVTADMQAIVREVMEEIMEPQMIAQLKQTWMSAPDELKEQYKRERPEEYRELIRTMKGE